MSDAAGDRTHFRLADVDVRKGVDFDLRPEETADLAARLELLDLRKLRFAGTLRPEGSRGWRLEARLGATVVQPCVVTLAPVTTRIEEDVLRRYTPDFDAVTGEKDADGVAMPEDDTLEPLPAAVDLAQVMEEALALALPLYPRAEGVEAAEAQFAAQGVEPLKDDDLKPFAGLAALRDKLGKEDPEG